MTTQVSGHMQKRPRLTARKSKRVSRRNTRRRSTQINPVSISSTFEQGKYKYHRFSENEQIIEGVDLFSLRYDYQTSPEGLQPFCVVPLNPLFWDGTRVKSIAATWSRYQPISFEVTYTPTVATTTPGQVIYGTFPPNPAVTRLDQFLISSNGGGLTTIYTVAKSRVDCSTNALGQKSFELNGDMSNPSCCPLQWVINHVITPNFQFVGTPGYITVHWKFRFSNPITGSAVQAMSLTSDPIPNSNRRAVPWGLVISALKDTAIRILRRVVVVILEEVLATIAAPRRGSSDVEDVITARIPQFQSLSFEISDSEECVVSNGQENYIVPPNTPVIAYMSGDEVHHSIAPDIEDIWQFVTARPSAPTVRGQINMKLLDPMSEDPVLKITTTEPTRKNVGAALTLFFHGTYTKKLSQVSIVAQVDSGDVNQAELVLSNPLRGIKYEVIRDDKIYRISNLWSLLFELGWINIPPQPRGMVTDESDDHDDLVRM